MRSFKREFIFVMENLLGTFIRKYQKYAVLPCKRFVCAVLSCKRDTVDIWTRRFLLYDILFLHSSDTMNNLGN